MTTKRTPAVVPRKLPTRGPPSQRLREKLRQALEDEFFEKLQENARSENLKASNEAIEMMLRYGVGQTKEVDLDKVRAKLHATLEAIRSNLPYEDAQRVIESIAPIWK